ncbi:uncharacterized protein EI97DRAFT_226694 [Westerdykella ornata]|uniref:GPI inositol-deacylase winged helix domain-containing protein n=1 Tax=Westerdykella ornata TaxID=318751 RepID=A0A6A6JR16_WESOR|nr:uncharacterized protein EI97DRAFT_226694 [Westerdykella ornata]KAF2279071.1 hypothetical protein EI97DRAFT_226694 [Westerdykella ornata]
MKVETMKKVLRWVSCAYRPLHIEELEEAVGLLKDDKIWPAERIVTGSGEKLVHACGHLVVYNRDDHTVTLAHPTVRQFLCSSSSSPEDSVPASIKFDMAEADTDIGEICVAYLNFSDLETQLIQVTPPTTMGRRQAERIVWKGVPLAPFLKGIMNRGRADDPFDSGTNVKDITYEFPRPKPTQNPTTKFSLLPYVIEYWAFHASGFTPELSCWEAFAHLTFHRNLLFQFRPWELTRSTNIVPADELVMPLYTWSMQHGIWSFVRLLVWNIDTYRLLKLHIHRRAMDLKVDPDWLFDDFLTLRFNLHVGRKAIHSCWSDNGTFWTCDDIYNIASQFQSDSRAVAFLRFLKTELETLGHSAGSGLLSKAFNGAMRLAISKLDVLTWRTLCQACISSFKQLSHAIVSFFQQHQHRPLSVPSIFGTFFSIDIGNDWPQFVDIALLKTLYVYLPEIEGAIAWKYINPKEMSQQCIWLLLVLAFTSISGSLSTIEVLLKHITGTALNFEFHRSKPERTTVASQSFVSLEGPSLLGMLFQCLRNSPISISKTKMKMIFEALNLNRFGRLPINSLEKKGIHCLAWAAELDMSDVVAQLMPHYQDQLRDCNEVYMTGSMGINVGVLSLSAAIGHSEDSLTEMLQWSWPHHVVHAVLEHPKVKSLKPINRRALEDMSKYPSIRPSRPQPLWPAVPEEAQED